MDFDEYDYLEKTVEDPELPKKEPPPSNGARSDGGEKGRSSKGRPGEDERDAKRPSSRARGRMRVLRGAATGVRVGASRQRSPTEHASGGNHERPEKDRHRSGGSREADKDRGRDMERNRERIRERNRETESERDRERDMSRRSRSHPGRQRDEERDRPKEREFRERERAPRVQEMRDREPAGRRYKEKKEDGTEPEADPERDQRTVFAYQIHLKADERDVYEFFSRAGKVRDVRLIMDRNSRRSKGVGYIEFYDVMSVPMAIALSGQLLFGQPVMVKPSEAEKNLVQSNTAAASSGGARRLYVFEPFGQVELVQLPLDPETLKCKGYGFIQFARLEDAKAAQNLNGQLEIAGRVIKVSAVSDQPGVQDNGANTGDFDDDGDLALNACSRALLMQKLDRSGMTTRLLFSRDLIFLAFFKFQRISCSSCSLGPCPRSFAHPIGCQWVALGAPPTSILGIPSGIASLVQPSLVGLPLPGSGLPVMPAAVQQADPIGVPSECLMLKNMFDPSLETEPDFDLDIKEDVQEECSKFGPLKHIFVDKNSAGYVYLRFESATAAISAQRALHGRWFAGKMITATFMLPPTYLAKFPIVVNWSPLFG
ncbi:unnamed protein product [Spirodela intermedia]|uniref:RRM domain-containing protein n=1 Tax=Spirodela intermedia TaxID=51605 RepID=A0A7I8J1P4_SPIIN|nr:unnamed protein product [Spirodela intermedia]CAA6663240.1 unnamed protein product [Spirodela intermedia]